MNSQTVYRRPHDTDNPYVVMSKFIFEDTDISWKAKGVMGYLLSRPNDWIVRHGDLVKRSPEGASAVRSAIRELEQHGYLTRTRTKDDHGRYNGIEVIIHEQPVRPEQSTYRPNADKPHDEKPHADSPNVEKETLLSIDPVLSNDSTKKTAGADSPFTDDPPPEPPRETAQERLKRMRAKLGDHPVIVGGNCKDAQEKEGQWTVTAAAGGDDSWSNGPVAEWCALIGLPIDNLPDSRRRYFATEIQKLAEEVHADPARTGKAIRQIATDDRYKWLRTAGSPKHSGFAEALKNVLCGLGDEAIAVNAGYRTDAPGAI